MNPDYHRRSIRLPGYDYSGVGEYFVTICTQNRKSFFGNIQKGVMLLNEFGQIAFDQWQKIPNRFKFVELGQFVVMPNHVHGIIVINDTSLVGAGFIPAQDDGNINVPSSIGHPQMGDGQPQGLPLRVTLGNIVGAYKSLVVRECLKRVRGKNENMGRLWQRNYYEHIIMTDKDYENIVNYIQENPMNWGSGDEYYQV